MKLSIVFPMRNRTKYIAQAIKSVLACLSELEGQGWEYELIVGDNASTVPIEPLVTELSPLIRYIKWPEDRGIFGNMNSLIAASDGDWIHCVHDDDWILPKFYERFCLAFEHPLLTQVISIGARLFREDDGNETSNEPWYDNSGLVDGHNLFGKLAFGNPFSICGMLVSREAYQRVGLYREDLPHAGDWDMWKRLALTVPWFWCIETLARYRVHKGTATSAYLQNGQCAVDIRKSIEMAATVCPMDSFEAFRTGTIRYMLNLCVDAAKLIKEDNFDLAKIYVQQANHIASLI